MSAAQWSNEAGGQISVVRVSLKVTRPISAVAGMRKELNDVLRAGVGRRSNATSIQRNDRVDFLVLEGRCQTTVGVGEGRDPSPVGRQIMTVRLLHRRQKHTRKRYEKRAVIALLFTAGLTPFAHSTESAPGPLRRLQLSRPAPSPAMPCSAIGISGQSARRARAGPKSGTASLTGTSIDPEVSSGSEAFACVARMTLQ